MVHTWASSSRLRQLYELLMTLGAGFELLYGFADPNVLEVTAPVLPGWPPRQDALRLSSGSGGR